MILKTTLGDIEVELWSKECPKTCRNFIQLCMEGYYNETIFHRIVKDFIAQGGDPTGTGEGGESIYGEPFKDEFHSRLKFNRRGLIGMANSQANDNTSQFFFTLGACQELNKKHTLFGKVAGPTVFNMIRLNELELVDERPVRPEKILATEIIFNPFDDIKPRNLRAPRQVVVEKPKEKGVRNFGLLSFGDEAEEDQEELEDVTVSYKSKPKSAHDVGDPSLVAKKLANEISSNETSSSDSGDEKTTKSSVDLDSIKSKLKKRGDKFNNGQTIPEKPAEKLDEKEMLKNQTRDEIKKIQRELSSKGRDQIGADETQEQIKESQIVKEYKEDVEKYEHLKKKSLKGKKEKGKEDKTLELLKSFRQKLFKAKSDKECTGDTEADKTKESTEKNDDEEIPTDSGSLWTHKLEISEEIKQKVIDANVADNDRWDIYDPRNPLNKRKREESKAVLSDKRRSGVKSRYDR